MQYQDLVNSYKNNPRDVHTIPMNKRIPSWFHVIVKGDKVYVGPAKVNQPSCSISSWRYLQSEEFDTMLDIYRRRMKGEKVSIEATRTTQNQVYWYGVFNDLKVQ